MPIYDYTCQCGYAGEHVAHIDDRLNCPRCNQPMERQMPFTHGVNMGASGAHGYYDENLDCYIGTNRQRREEMRKQGVSEAFGKGWY